MEILRDLGVNFTVGIQLIIFLLTYLVLHFVLFKPYFAAYSERVRRTMGQTEQAERFVAESLALQSEYETKARELAGVYKSIFDESRSRAMREYDRLVNEARLAAKTDVDSRKAQIRKALESARQDLQKEVPAVAGAITARLLGKDLNQ